MSTREAMDISLSRNVGIEPNLPQQGDVRSAPRPISPGLHAPRSDVVLLQLFPNYLSPNLDVERQAWSPRGVEPSLRRGRKIGTVAGPSLACVARLVGFATKDRLAVLLNSLAHIVVNVVVRRTVAPAS
jgi:hypothetical protein